MKIYASKILVLIFSFTLGFYYLIAYVEFKAKLDDHHMFESAIVNAINLKGDLGASREEDDILCRNSSMKSIYCTICLHDLDKDVYVSGTIWRDGVWEPHILSIKLKLMRFKKKDLNDLNFQRYFY
jgi:hypothetical protein